MHPSRRDDSRPQNALSGLGCVVFSVAVNVSCHVISDFQFLLVTSQRVQWLLGVFERSTDYRMRALNLYKEWNLAPKTFQSNNIKFNSTKLK